MKLACLEMWGEHLHVLSSNYQRVSEWNETRCSVSQAHVWHSGGLKDFGLNSWERFLSSPEIPESYQLPHGLAWPGLTQCKAASNVLCLSYVTPF